MTVLSRKRIEAAMRGSDRTIYPKVIAKIREVLKEVVEAEAKTPLNIYTVSNGPQKFMISSGDTSVNVKYECFHGVPEINITLTLIPEVKHAEKKFISFNVWWQFQRGWLWHKTLVVDSYYYFFSPKERWHYNSKPLTKRLDCMGENFIRVLGLREDV